MNDTDENLSKMNPTPLTFHPNGDPDWRARAGAIGGASKSTAKAAAAVLNGRKGGRPRKATQTPPEPIQDVSRNDPENLRPEVLPS